MTHQTHFFFAVKIPEETKLIMKNHMEHLKKMLPFSRWVHHQDLHITLAFLGNAPSDKLTAADLNVQKALRSEERFTLRIDKLGTFGAPSSPRIFWADTQRSDELNNVRKKVFTACEEAGFQLESRPFRPHITLARKWIGEERFEMGLLEEWNRIQKDPLVFEAKEVILYQTHLQKTPKYEEKKVYPLG
nr:RNA 2',3'-cyclic phosphodiesterase [Neobacillus sp. Marseille-Q6967]